MKKLTPEQKILDLLLVNTRLSKFECEELKCKIMNANTAITCGICGDTGEDRFFEKCLNCNTAEDEVTCYLVKCDWKTAYLELAKMVDKQLSNTASENVTNQEKVTNTAEDEEGTDLYNMVIEHISGVIPECVCDHCLEGKIQIAIRKHKEWLVWITQRGNNPFLSFGNWLQEEK